jgi:hypothetical protein
MGGSEKVGIKRLVSLMGAIQSDPPTKRRRSRERKSERRGEIKDSESGCFESLKERRRSEARFSGVDNEAEGRPEERSEGIVRKGKYLWGWKFEKFCSVSPEIFKFIAPTPSPLADLKLSETSAGATRAAR